jgi:alpha-beta hydrolase superfamily lysophospholipase
MDKCTIEAHTASDGYRWRYRRYAPLGMMKALIVCVHGIQSHGGWYEHSCQRLSQAGYSVCFLDRRGAGLNQEARGDALSFRRLLDDLAEFIQFEKARPLTIEDRGSKIEERKIHSRSMPDPRSSIFNPQSSLLNPQSSLFLPTFLLAISWGGKLAVALERRSPGLVDGLALLCPGFFPKVRPSFGRRLGIALARLGSPRKLFPIPLNDPELFTGNPRWQEFIQEDPLSLRQATARLLVESVRLDGYLRFAPPYVKIPVLALLAEQDRIIDNRRTRRFIERFASGDKNIIEYPGAHHTLEFEPDPEVYLSDLLRWLQSHKEAMK